MLLMAFYLTTKPISCYWHEKIRKGGLDSIPPYFCMAAEGTGAGNGFIPSTIHMVALMDASQIEPME